MKVGPSEPLYGGRFQTTRCCVGWRPSWWATREKAHSMRQVGIRKTVRSPDFGIAVDVSLLT